MFQVSRPYLGFCPDLKHFIVNSEQNIVKYADADRPYLVFSELKPETHMYIFFALPCRDQTMSETASGELHVFERIKNLKTNTYNKVVKTCLCEYH